MARHDFRTPRVFLEADLQADTVVSLSRDQANYVQNVMRLSPGAEILVFNGRDGEWRAALEGAKRKAALRLLRCERAQTAPGELACAFAPLKHARLDYTVQKAVELGVASLTPVITQHTQVSRVNLERMRANVIEAAEQCGVLAVPRVDEPTDFGRWLAGLDRDRVLVFCDEEAEISDPVEALRRAPQGPLAVAIGPEGGFSDGERRAMLARANTVRLSLGPRVLRADTAAVAALALVQAARGDWR